MFTTFYIIFMCPKLPPWNFGHTQISINICLPVRVYLSIFLNTYFKNECVKHWNNFNTHLQLNAVRYRNAQFTLNFISRKQKRCIKVTPLDAHIITCIFLY